MNNKLYEIVKKYKCSVCDYLLSVAPVMITHQDNGSELYKCGRCQRINCDKYRWTRNRLFEEMAQDLNFPCSYPPCTEALPWGKVEEHEGNCRYKTIKCPLSDDCERYDHILVDMIGEHVADKHQNNIRKVDATGNGWRVHLRMNYMFIVEVDNQYFFVYIRGWNRVAVMSTRCSKYTKFSVKMKFNAEDYFAVSIDNLPVIPYNNNVDKISTNNFMNNLENNLSNTFHQYNRHISVCITFIADKDPDQSTEDVVKEEDKIPLQFNVEVIKKILSCPYCVTYLTAPIFTCTTGHTICNECKSRLEKCPTCQASLDGPRMYALEEMADDVKMPCQFDFKGCSFVGNTSRLCTHQLECVFGSNV